MSTESSLQPRWQMPCTCRWGALCDTCQAQRDVRAMAFEMAELIIDRAPGTGMAVRLQEIADR